MKLSNEIKSQLHQGCKVEFKWYGSKDLYTGRIEIGKHGGLYFVNEHCYDGDKLKEIDEPMRYYNPIESFEEFTYFKILEHETKAIEALRKAFRISNAVLKCMEEIQIAIGIYQIPNKMKSLHKMVLFELEKPNPDMMLVNNIIEEIQNLPLQKTNVNYDDKSK